MRKFFLVILLVFIFPFKVDAGRGCCSHHGGECGCNKYGRTICCDNTLSPSCRCNPPKINGCTDPKAYNYNSDANNDDGSCKYNVYGCTDKTASNYNYSANIDDGSCIYQVNEEQVGFITNYSNTIIDSNDYIDYSIKKDNKPKGISNDTSTFLFYLITILGGSGYGIYKMVNKR